MSITIYQIPVSNRMADEANRGNVAKALDVRCELMMNAGKKYKPEYFQYYAPTFKVNTDDLEDAFRLTNLWDNEDMIERLPANPRGFSSSVGDIFAREGKFFIVDSFGFKEVEVA